jgi:hypothetical protein
LKVCLSRDGHIRQPQVHRLVTVTFLGPAPDGYEVNHRDGHKRNNALDNLEYLTPEENRRHARQLGLFKSKLSQQQVREIRLLRLLGVHTKTIALWFKLSRRWVEAICAWTAWKDVA